MKHSGYLALFGTALLWSFTGVLVASNHLSAVLVSAGNALFAIVSCVLIARPKLHFNPLIIAVGIAQFIVAITFNAGNQLSTVGNVIVLQYCSMVFVIVYQSIDTRKLPPVKQVVFVTLAILGMVLFFFDELSPEGALGNLCAIVSGIFFGLMFYLNSKPSSDAVISYMISCVIAMAVGAVSLVTAGGLPRFSFQDIASMAVNGFICQGIASVLLAHGLKSVPPFSSNLICMSEVILAPLWAFVLFGQGFGRFALIGAALIVLSIVLNLHFEQQQTAAAKDVSPEDAELERAVLEGAGTYSANE